MRPKQIRMKRNLSKPEIDPPGRNVLEVSLFGPGYGESVVIHAGEEDWLIIDSCVLNDKKTPAALSYLMAIGVDPSTAVKLILATHWHDDHIRGIAHLYRACNKAIFSCSQALNKEDFITLAYVALENAKTETSGTDEFTSVLQELGMRGDSPVWAIADRPLWNREIGINSKLWALSPSNRIVSQSFQSVGQNLIPDKSPTKRIPPPEINHGAVVSLLKVGDIAVLLGADLENTTSMNAGWSAVIGSHSRPKFRAKIYKVSHHGSASSDSPEIWSELLENQPIAILTPFSRGNSNLPTTHDIQRLNSHTSQVFTTKILASKRAITGSGPIARTKREALRHCHKLTMVPGHVRVRIDIKTRVENIDLFDGAKLLAN